MPTATETPAIDLKQLDELAAEAQEELGELDRAEAGLSLDALSDPAAEEKLREVQSRRGVCLGTIRQAELAHAEFERRQAEARREDERVKREEAEAEARELHLEREAAAAGVDEACDALAAALASYADVKARQNSALLRARRRQLEPVQSAFGQALIFAFRAHSVPGGLFDLPGSHRLRAIPFAEQDPRPIAPVPDGVDNDNSEE